MATAILHSSVDPTQNSRVKKKATCGLRWTKAINEWENARTVNTSKQRIPSPKTTPKKN